MQMRAGAKKKSEVEIFLVESLDNPKKTPHLRPSFHLVFWGLLAVRVRKYSGGFSFGHTANAPSASVFSSKTTLPFSCVDWGQAVPHSGKFFLICY